MMEPLIQPTDLADLLAAGECVVLDCRFDLGDPAAGRRVYANGHIPSACYADLELDLSSQPDRRQGRHPLPDPAELARKLGSWGVGNTRCVVAYDDGGGALASRAWWLLRWLGHDDVAVLDGGFAAWRVAGLPIETEVPRPRPADFVPRLIHNEWVVSSDELPAFLNDGLLLDARAPARFRGELEPIDPVAGHVPGAVNYCFENSLSDRRTFLSPDVLRERLRGLLAGHPVDRVAVMCGSGVTACHVLLALSVAGLGDGKLYAGSWSEWIRDPKRPVATGER